MEQDQKEFLNSALKSVKTSSQQMKNSINQNDMRQCLKYANELLSELKTSLLSPSNYYQLYSAIFDEIIYLQNYFRDESKRGRRIKELYETVQQSISVVPRVYLLIIVGTIFIESEQCEKKEEVIYDIIQMIKGVQNPIRGLFIRYFLLKMLKDYLNCFHLIDNFKDMNKLWIRINKMNNFSFEQIINIRNDMKVLIGENINRLACLNNLNSDFYRNKILIPIFQIISLSNDDISQQYIIECLIHAFPDEFNIKSMDIILNSFSNMNPKIDINNIIISILDKFKDIIKIIQLQNSYLKFILNYNNFDNPEIKYKSINEIIGNFYEILNKEIGNKKLSKEGMRLINILLNELLKSPISIFKIKHFPDLMFFLEGEYKTSLTLRIINSFVNEFNRGNIDSYDKMESLIEFIKPMIQNDNNINYNEKIFDDEQSTISKLVYIPSSHNPQEQYEMICLLKKTLIDFAKSENIEISNKKLIYYYSNLVNALLLLIYGVNEAYGNKKGINNILKKNKIQINFANNYNIEQFDLENEDSFFLFYQNVYKTINEILNELSIISPNISFKLYLECAENCNKLKSSNKNKYEELCYIFLSSALDLIINGKISEQKRFDFLTNFFGTILNNKILSEDNYINLANNLEKISISLFKRKEQCISMINCSKLYYNDILKKKDKVSECLLKAKKFAEYAMTSPNNAILFIYILNEYMRYLKIKIRKLLIILKIIL